MLPAGMGERRSLPLSQPQMGTEAGTLSCQLLIGIVMEVTAVMLTVGAREEEESGGEGGSTCGWCDRGRREGGEGGEGVTEDDARGLRGFRGSWLRGGHGDHSHEGRRG